ncbi:MAG: pantothenate kinase [Gammaproteobacteria bacterium]|nr:pantothenate kinase [Gammaproteobacteria bacterium]
MILELDVGNTRIKWRRKSMIGDEVIADGVFPDENEFLSASLRHEKPQVFRFSSVRSQLLTERLVSWSCKHWNLEPLIAKVSRKCGGVTVNYPDVSRLGVDRWLALLAGYKIASGACVIVDCGTAFTLDSIANTGNHLGGYILPGLALTRQSLEANTSISLSAEAIYSSIALGNSTDEAVLNGSLAALVALVEKEVAKLKALEGSCRLIFTGGDAGLLKDSSKFICSELVPSLVLDGLDIACPSHQVPSQ